MSEVPSFAFLLVSQAVIITIYNKITKGNIFFHNYNQAVVCVEPLLVALKHLRDLSARDTSVVSW